MYNYLKLIFQVCLFSISDVLTRLTINNYLNLENSQQLCRYVLVLLDRTQIFPMTIIIERYGITRGISFCLLRFYCWAATSVMRVIATSVMRLFHTISKTWYKVLHQHTMYVISLSNISTKTNFKQITRIELNLPNLYNTLMGITCCTWHHVSLLSDHF